MIENEYGPLNVTIRVYETELLKQSVFDRMLAANSFEEAVNVLRETAYREEVEDVLRTHNYDDMITENLERMYNRLFQIAPDPQIIELATLRYTYQNIKVIIKELISGRDLDELFFPIGRYDLTDIRQAVTLRQSKVLPQAYLTAIQAAIEDYDDYKNIQQLDVLLDRYYFEHLKQLALEIGNPAIIEWINMQIDFTNISTLIRAKYQDRTTNYLRSVLSDAGTLDVETLIQVGTKDARSLIQTLSETKYKDLLSESLITKGIGISSIKFDYYTDNAFMKKMQEAKLQAFGPLPLLAYIFAKETEARNLRLVLSAKENHIDMEETRERMRMNYVS